MASGASCTYADSDTASRYVAGTLPAPEAEAFEEHWFGCERCWREVKTGSAVRASLHSERVQRHATGRTWWLGVAAAALLAVLGAGVLRERMDRDAGPDVLRGASSTIVVTVHRSDAQVRVVWRAVPRAARYDVTVHGSEGDTLIRRNTTETTITFAPPKGERELYIRVAGSTADGEEIARSPLVRAPSR